MKMRELITLLENIGAIEFRYLTDCSNPDIAPFLEDMIQASSEISYDEFLSHVDDELLQRVFPRYDWDDGDGVALRDARGVGFYQSKISGFPCVFVNLGGTEYVFVPRNVSDGMVYG